MSSLFDRVAENAQRKADCAGHVFVELTREDQVRTQTYRDFRCSECNQLFERAEKLAYEQGVKHGKAFASDMLATCQDCGSSAREGVCDASCAAELALVREEPHAVPA